MVYCKHLRGIRRCVAFPKGIPREIFFGERDHLTPYPGDNGIMFERIEPKTHHKKKSNLNS